MFVGFLAGVAFALVLTLPLIYWLHKRDMSVTKLLDMEHLATLQAFIQATSFNHQASVRQQMPVQSCECPDCQSDAEKADRTIGFKGKA